MTSKTAICFGETLWDIFPTHKTIGGAPLNVASRLTSLGIQSKMISRVGDDFLGQGLLEYLDTQGVDNKMVQVGSAYSTGQVLVTLDKSGVALYDVKYPSAWDFITIEKQVIEEVKKADVFVYGSLIARGSRSKATLLNYLDNAQFKVFDVNLRPPHYSISLLEQLMEKADVIKFNEEELTEICAAYESPFDSLARNIPFISNKTNTKIICVTRGSRGAVLYLEGEIYSHQGYSIDVIDTVGAGDSFLATLVEGILSGKTPSNILSRACAIGALVASCEGANPPLTNREINALMGRD